MARRVLAASADAGARITVLAVGVWLDSQPDMARLILDGCHELGNHTQHHGDISAMSARAFADARIEEARSGETTRVSWLPDTLEDATAAGLTDMDTTQAITYRRRRRRPPHR